MASDKKVAMNESETLMCQEFEKWCDDFGFQIGKDGVGDYISVLTGNLWVIVRNAAAQTERRTAERCAEIAFDADTNYDAKHAIRKEFHLDAE